VLLVRNADPQYTTQIYHNLFRSARSFKLLIWLMESLGPETCVAASATIRRQRHMIVEASISPKIGRRSTITRYWIPLAVFGSTFLFLIITMDRFVNQYDEALILLGSTRVLAGDIPYRDFHANYGPAQSVPRSPSSADIRGHLRRATR